MAESKSTKNTGELVAISPLVIWTGKDGRLNHTAQGGVIARDAVDPDHLKMLEDEGHVGSAKEAEKAAEADSES